jgi:outer membrane protein OmpA-like peptidoglycan-associated protein
VAKYLIDNKIAQDRIKVEYFGEEKPLESNSTKEGRSKNRRVEFVIIEK